MLFQNKFSAVFCLLALFVAGSNLDAQELTTNGDFEAGDTSGWTEFATASSTFGVTSDAFEGSFAGELFNDASASALVVKQANIGIGTVFTGQEISISFRAKGEGEAGGVSFAEFFSEISGGGVSGSEILGGAPLGLTNDWQEFTFNTTAGSDVSGGVTLQFTATTGAATGSQQRLFIDNVSVVAAVPEPGSLAALGLASLGLLICRRRN